MKTIAPNGEFRQTSANYSLGHVLLSAPKPEDVQTTTKNLVRYILYGKLALLFIQYGSTKASYGYEYISMYRSTRSTHGTSVRLKVTRCHFPTVVQEIVVRPLLLLKISCKLDPHLSSNMELVSCEICMPALGGRLHELPQTCQDMYR